MRSSSEPVQTEDKAISLATCSRNRLKGMRRRAAKLLTCIRADSFEYQSPDMQASGELAIDVTVELEGMVCQLQSSMTENSSAGQSHHTTPHASPSFLVCHAYMCASVAVFMWSLTRVVSDCEMETASTMVHTYS